VGVGAAVGVGVGVPVGVAVGVAVGVGPACAVLAPSTLTLKSSIRILRRVFHLIL
jgi:hypothetical protein